jgi:peptidoglycan/xylan/chitin deacetylase (PgdA/CDA1 family)
MALTGYAAVLMYHDVRDPEATAFPRRYRLRSFLSPQRLAEQLDDIVRAFHVVPLADFGAALTGKAGLPDRAVALTFDDGLKDHHDVVLPLLQERRLPATFFVPAGPVRDRVVIPAHKIQFLLAGRGSEPEVVAEIFRVLGEKRRAGESIPDDDTLWATWSVSRWPNSWWSPEMVFVTRVLREGVSPALSTELTDRLFARFVSGDERAFAEEFHLSGADVKDLADAGMSVGGHGVRSINLEGLPESEQEDEIVGSRRYLRDEVGVEGPLLFSYPNGGRDAATMALLTREGFVLAVTTRRGPVVATVHALDLARFDGPQDLPELVASAGAR